MEIVPAKNVNEIVHSYCESIVMVNKTGSCKLDVFIKVSSAYTIWATCKCVMCIIVLTENVYYSIDSNTFTCIVD